MHPRTRFLLAALVGMTHRWFLKCTSSDFFAALVGMTHRYRWLSRCTLRGFMLLMLILASCAAPTPAPTPTPGATATAVPQAEPSATVIPAAAPGTRLTRGVPRPAATYPARPTATPYEAQEEGEEGVYADAASSLKVRSPDRWMPVPPDQGSDVLQYFTSPGGSVTAGVIVNPAGGDSLKSVAGEIRGAVLGGLQSIRIVSDQADRMA